MSIKLLFVRHGQTDWNLQQRLQGHSDQPLNATGRRQAQALATRLATTEIDAIVSSDLARARDTARLLAAQHDVTVELDRRLREYSFGQWQGLTWQEIEGRFPDEARAWRSDRSNAPPGGESAAAVSRRLQSLLTDLRQRQGTIVLVAHGGPLRTLACLLLELPLTQHWRLRLDNVSVSRFALHDRGAILEQWNDQSHLNGKAIRPTTDKAMHSK